jgi:hypothetical protein
LIKSNVQEIKKEEIKIESTKNNTINTKTNSAFENDMNL